MPAHPPISENTLLLNRSRQAVWHPCTQMKQHEQLPLVPVTRAEGCWLYDADGRRYLDAVSSWWVNLFGHAEPRINAAITAQMQSLSHVMLAGFTHRPVVELSEQLSALTDGVLGHCFYGSDGASATEIALKMSFHFWRNTGQDQKTQFVSLAGSYHGETLGALSVTDVALFKDTYAPLLRQSATVPSPDWRLASAGISPQAHAQACAQALESHLEQHHAKTAALIIEPLVQGATGMAMYDASYLCTARALCDRYGVHLIADEIMTGFGRTGTFFAYQQAAISPDFLCLSKGITGGYLPLSVVLCRDAVYQAFYDDALSRGFLHSHSYTGNALACAAALASLAIFKSDDVIASNRQRAIRWSRLAAPLRQHPAIRHWRQTGMIWAFDVDTSVPQFAQRLFSAALAQGILLRPIGKTVYFMPPYSMLDEEFQQLINGTIRALNHTLSLAV